jgi:hypothetical protein
MSDSTEGAFSVGLPACTPLVLVGLSVHDGAKGAFNAGLPARILNSSPSQTRFKESTPMRSSCDLFYEGS